MFKVFTNAWRVPEIRRKILYVVLVLAIYRLGAHIPLPGLDLYVFEEQRLLAQDNPMLLFSIITGGGFATILTMGIGPYITASIIMQLLTVAIPKLEQLQKEGEDGRKRIAQYTRVVAVALAFLQGAGMVFTYSHMGLFQHPNLFVYAIAVLSMVTGTIFVMWLGELLTERGIGNGASFLIFANIISNLPAAVMGLYTMSVGGVMNVVITLFVIALFIMVMVFVVFIQGGERRIPVQYSKKMVGRQMYGGQSSYIPIKANIAGVLSIIFAISLLQFPSMIGQFIQNNPVLETMSQWLDTTHYFGAALYVILIFFFTFFYTSFAVNPVEMAENMKKNGGFVPGIRPGKPTSDYIARVIGRMSWIGATAYAIIAITPIVMEWVFQVNVGFGGTTLLIVTGVCLEIVKQLESQLLMRHYKGFLS